MAENAPGCVLGDLLGNDRLGLTLLAGDADSESRPVSDARLCMVGDLNAAPDDVVLVALPDRGTGENFLAGIAPVLGLPGSRIIAVWPPAGVSSDELRQVSGRHVLVGVPAETDPAELIGEIARSTALVEDALTQRLTSLQRSLTQALAAPTPLQALTTRLAKVCNAVVTIVGSSGTAEFATGPLPLSLLLPEINRTGVDSRTFALRGWYGMAVKITGRASSDEKTGWLLVASRRESFPDPYSVAAIYVAASLAETSMQIDLAAQRQERAVRSSVLEQALSMRLERHDAELAGKITALGLSFGQEVRSIAVELVPGAPSARDGAVLDTMYHLLQRTLATNDVPHLLALRENAVVGLVQSSVPAMQRAFVQITSPSREFLLGIGRDIADVGHVVDSYHDAQLAVRVLRREGATTSSMAYEEFDFATRLFSDVGLDKMAEWAHELLRPLEDQPMMLDSLATYFEHSQNIMSAADSLMVHHNSLRYRLAKIETALDVNLRDPAAVSSLFLALTALSMVRAESQTTRSITPNSQAVRAGDARGADAANAVLNEYQLGMPTRFGAAVGPER